MIRKLSFYVRVCFFVCGLLLFWSGKIEAAKTSVNQLVLGKVVTINGQRFIKIANDPVKGAQFMAMEPAVVEGGELPPDPPEEPETMQTFSVADCEAYPIPVATEYTPIGYLKDERDDKLYEIRKFADGKCWMVDNLAYGGMTDGCAGVGLSGFVDATYGGVNGMMTPSNRFGTGTYGNCADPRAESSAGPCHDSLVCGYYYNWQAVMQSALAYSDPDYYGSNYRYGPTSNVQGVCPAGWHVPSGGYNTPLTSEFAQLDIANGGTGEERVCSSASCMFWTSSGGWRDAYAGFCIEDGNMCSDNVWGRLGMYWTSTEGGYLTSIDDSGGGNVYLSPGNGYGRGVSRGLSVRCVKDTVERTMQAFTTADCNAYPTPTGTDYVPVGYLEDERDGKWYEIRKFSDGKCWMVDNLANGETCAPGWQLPAGETRCVKDTVERTMQNFVVADCAAYPTPAAAGYTSIGYLRDERDGKWYEIRKFSDGKCWMVDNLANGETCAPGWQLPAGETRCVKDTVERTMQNFVVADCNAYPTPTGTDYAPVGYLQDERDGKWYEIRKFSDGKCWMVDNLMYGGAVDDCAGGKLAYSYSAYGDGEYGGDGGMAAPSNRFGIGTYGSCLDPRVGGVAPCTHGSTACGYLYNWQAVMQHSSAYIDSTYTGPTTNVQGICPSGWHVPSGDQSGEYQTLHITAGWPQTGFWQDGNWKGAVSYIYDYYSGYSDVDNSAYWSSTVGMGGGSWAYSLNLFSDGIHSGTDPWTGFAAYEGLNVRCIKDTDCFANCSSCDSATTCNQCVAGYVLDGGSCIPTGTMANCIAYSAPDVCSACSSGYVFENGECLLDCTNPANLVGTMQTFTTGQCSAYATPDPLGYTQIGCLADARDDKVYEIRKFADGKCWMVDNLAYGGDAATGGMDECASKTTFHGYGNKSGSAWGYGDCRNNPGVNYGYLYNWQAAVQDTDAYYGYDDNGHDNSYQPPEPTQGICPTGWHLPTSGTASEFAVLDIANTGRGNNYTNSDITYDFFQPGHNFKTAYAGLSFDSGSLDSQGYGAYWWSSTQYNAYYSYYIGAGSNGLQDDRFTKDTGFSVRCIKN